MAKIHTLKISNYRCVDKFEQVFFNSSYVCLIGRGDSGKTTLLNAISAVLSPNWNFSFYDTDFNKGNIEIPIEIEVSLYDVPQELLTDSKFGLHKRILNSENIIINDVLSEDYENSIDILTVKLVVNKDLEPKWVVKSYRELQDDIEISATDRSKLNVFFVSEYLDRHFSCSKGTPIYSMLKKIKIEDETDKIITDASRKTKDVIKKSDSFNAFSEIIKNIKNAATSFGLSIHDLEILFDFKESVLREGNIALHSDNIPYRLNGKGTKRLLSIAIQLELAKQGGIILIDELEQGLEPDRAKLLAKKLKDIYRGQVFITTHSSNVLVELEAKNIFLKTIGSQELFSFSQEFQGCIRQNPEVFFAKRIIVCEGATEVGICRALNDFRIQAGFENLAVLGIAIADGTGSNFVEYCHSFKKSGYDVCALCDSDDDKINSKKPNLVASGVKVIDCENSKSIEQQLFKDLPWNKIVRLLHFAVIEKTANSILTLTGYSSLNDIIKTENQEEMRVLLGELAKKNGWYKRTDHGEKIGGLWFSSLPELNNSTLKIQYDNLTTWINN